MFAPPYGGHIPRSQTTSHPMATARMPLPTSLVLLLLLAMGAVGVASVEGGQHDPALVERLDFDSYKELIRGLADFGDREQGTERNERANDWIEAQLRAGATRPSGITTPSGASPAGRSTPRRSGPRTPRRW
jgi:hypothetical protein